MEAAITFSVFFWWPNLDQDQEEKRRTNPAQEQGKQVVTKRLVSKHRSGGSKDPGGKGPVRRDIGREAGRAEGGILIEIGQVVPIEAEDRDENAEIEDADTQKPEENGWLAVDQVF